MKKVCTTEVIHTEKMQTPIVVTQTNWNNGLYHLHSLVELAIFAYPIKLYKTKKWGTKG